MIHWLQQQYKKPDKMKYVNNVTFSDNCVTLIAVKHNIFKQCKNYLQEHLLIYENKTKKPGCK